MASFASNKIPKIIHQIWIGDKPAPTKFMNTWRDKNPDFEYIRWNEEEFIKRDFKIQLKEKIDSMEEINGKADIIRWEILYKYGGVFVDADSICIEPIDDHLMNTKGFAGFEHEILRKAGWAMKGYDDVLASTHALIATGTMGFPPKHDLPRMATEEIKNSIVSVRQTGRRAWRTVGPGMLTRLYYNHNFKDITIFPSYYFLPIHCSGTKYEQHGKVYAYQEWGSTKQNYDKMNELSLPNEFNSPKESVSVLVSSYNTKAIYVKECLESIISQVGYFNIELVWINDGSDQLNTTILRKMLKQFKNTTRFTNLIYDENDGNMGIGYTLNKGVKMCNNEIIIKMDSDDIMVPNRIQCQFEFMKNNPSIHICGSQVDMFMNDVNMIVNRTSLPPITWEEYKKNPKHWFVNHPTVCYRKSSILKAGNYDKNLVKMCEDFHLELRMLKMFGRVYNLPISLLKYRLHADQVTQKGRLEEGNQYWNDVRNKIISKILE